MKKLWRDLCLASLLLSGTSVSAEEDNAQSAFDIWVVNEILVLLDGCAALISDFERLSCFDMIQDVTAGLEFGLAPGSGEEGAPQDITMNTGRCEIEDWVYGSFGSTGYTKVEGATTCQSGRITFRFYSEDRFLGSKTAYIDGYAFETFAEIGPTPRTLEIRYTIEQR